MFGEIQHRNYMTNGVITAGNNIKTDDKLEEKPLHALQSNIPKLTIEQKRHLRSDNANSQ